MSIHFRAFVQIGLGIVLALQLLYVSQRFDAYILVMADTVDGWRALFGYLGRMAKIAVLFVVVLCMLLQKELPLLWRSIRMEADIKRAALGMLPQLLSFWALVHSSIIIFDFSVGDDTPDTFEFLQWLLALLACLTCWTLMVAPARFWLQSLQRYWRPIVIAGFIAAAVWHLTEWMSYLWVPLSSFAFTQSSSLLTLLNPDLVVVNENEKILGLGDFVVSVAPACSGYEGIGLVTAFLTLYLYINREELRFPHAFILFPIGIVTIWLLNTVRIAILVALGYYWSADIAIGGFHSQAGWVAFIVTSIGLLWCAGRWRFVMQPSGIGVAQQELPAISKVADGGRSVQAIAMLMPLVVLLVTVLLTSALSSGFVWLYPVRVMAVLVALVWYWPSLRLSPYRISTLGFGAGVAVGLMWIGMLFDGSPEADLAFSDTLQASPPLWAILWVLFRFIGAAVTVPIAEELAFRGYLLCKLSGSTNYSRGHLAVSVVAVGLSSLAFGVLHGAWVAGTVAGLIYAYVRLRSQHVGDAIVAHAVTNVLVFAFAAQSGQWSMI